MAYTRFHADWQNDPEGGTPIDEAAMDHIETGIEEAHATLAGKADATHDHDPALTDLAPPIAALTASLSAGQAYRHPTTGEAADAAAGVRRLIGGTDAAALLTPLGMTVGSGWESASKRPYVLAQSETGTERAWAWILVDRSAPIGTVIGCPHPLFDETTELLGLELWRLIPGALLLIAGAHRDAGGGTADPRDNSGTLFHQIAADLISNAGLPHVQLHGFADASAPDTDIVLSSGATVAGTPIKRMGRDLASAGLSVAEYWVGPVAGLGGTTNIQGTAAKDSGTVFYHVESSTTTRTTPTKRAQLLAALAGSDPAGSTRGFTTLANAVTGQFPVDVGATNTTGVSPYAARSDHRHGERASTVARIDALETNGRNGLANARLSGRKSTTGAPTSGTWATGDLIIDSANAWHYCTTGGTPGTWT